MRCAIEASRSPVGATAAAAIGCGSITAVAASIVGGRRSAGRIAGPTADASLSAVAATRCGLGVVTPKGVLRESESGETGRRQRRRRSLVLRRLQLDHLRKAEHDKHDRARHGRNDKAKSGEHAVIPSLARTEAAAANQRSR